MNKKCIRNETSSSTNRDQQIQALCLYKLIRNRKFKFISIAILIIGIVFGIPIILIVNIHKPINISTTVVITTTTATKIMNTTCSKKWATHGIYLTRTEFSSGWREPVEIFDFYIDDDDNQTIYYTDPKSRCIIRWKTNPNFGEIIFGGDGFDWQSEHPPLLGDIILDKHRKSIIFCDLANENVVRWSYVNLTDREILFSDIFCTDLYVDKDGYFYVGDSRNKLIKRWKDKHDIETIITANFSQRIKTNTSYEEFHIAIDSNNAIYISIPSHHTVYKLTDNSSNASIVAGGNGPGIKRTQLNNPNEILLDDSNDLYIANVFSSKVLCWGQRAKEGHIIVEGYESRSARINHPMNPFRISFDKYGNLYVADRWRNHIQKFLVDLS